MKKPFFTPDDFRAAYNHFGISVASTMSEIANAKLDKLIESWPVVYGSYDGKTFTVPDPKLGLKSGTSTPDTHTARLAFIQPIAPCKHEPYLSSDGGILVDAYGDSECRHCGVELVAEWKAK